MGLLEGKVVIVTGAGRGIGRAEAHELAGHGARVVVSDIDSEAAQAVAAEITGSSGVAIAQPGDCADDDTAGRLIDGAVARFGGLDGLVNNAGILRDRTLAKMSAEEWDSVVRVNLRGHYAPTRAAIAHWRAVRSPGRVVCTSSTSGLLGGFGQSNYGAAKAGIAAFARIVAQEVWQHGITVNAICPAARTQLSEGAFGQIGGHDVGFDFWHPVNVAPFVAFLCSDDAAQISGQVFGVQGDTIELYRPWTSEAVVTNDGIRWDATTMGARVDDLFEATGTTAEPEQAMARLRYSMRAGDSSSSPASISRTVPATPGEPAQSRSRGR